VIFVSSSCSDKKSIKEAIIDLAEFGFKNIELSGGTKYYKEYYEDICELKEKLNLTYRLHNYFPPPEKSFVLNLASSNELVLDQSREMVKKALEMSSEFNSIQLGIHAGFRISPRVEELGKKIQSANILDYDESLARFSREFSALQEYGKNLGVELLLENNVFSSANFQSFGGKNPFFLTDSSDLAQMREVFSFSLLLDVAHLKVSCQTLGLNFEKELCSLLPETNYIHLSDNQGDVDSNNEFFEESIFMHALKTNNTKKRTFTIEVYDGLETVRRCHTILEKHFGEDNF
jgi:sugar phosphate isomerase/epimerase